MFICVAYVRDVRLSVKPMTALWIPQMQQILSVNNDTAWQGVPWTCALKLCSFCLKSAYYLHVLRCAECITSCTETEGAHPEFFASADISAPMIQTGLEVLCQTAALFNPLPPHFFPACVAGGEPCRQGHQPVQPLAGRPVQELYRLLLWRAAAHRQLPSAQDHRQGKLCQGQAGPPHPDGQGGKTRGSGGPGWEEGIWRQMGGWSMRKWCF